MADNLTHFFFAEDMLNKLYDSDLAHIINSRKHLFFLGAMGPDVFFFSGMNPLSKSENILKLAKAMHREKTGDFLNNGIEFLKKMDNSSEEYKDLLAYLVGFICHYSSDRFVHPYVYWAQLNNVYTVKGEKVEIRHVELEGIIDSILSNERLGKDSKYINGNKYIKDKKEIPNIIKEFLVYSSKSIYDLDILQEDVQKTVNTGYFTFWLFIDPKGMKSSVLNFFLKFFNKKPVEFHSQFAYDSNIDYMNSKRRKWFNPVDKKEVHKESFYDLLEIALEKGNEQINRVIGILYNSDVKAEDISIFENLGYDTNKPFDEKHQEILNGK
ncbi:zinc dependent phospholipase C family protein [Clostridium sp. DL1XJH146]